MIIQIRVEKIAGGFKATDMHDISGYEESDTRLTSPEIYAESAYRFGLRIGRVIRETIERDEADTKPK